MKTRLMRMGMRLKRALGGATTARQDLRREIAGHYIRGTGLEIGALHQPLPVPPRTTVRYVDRMTVAELRRHYPEFDALPLVPVDIIDDGSTLATVDDESQDFLIGNHLIEHCPNPISALYNWMRVLKPGGILYVSVPDKRATFDRDRPATSLDHVLRDFHDSPEWSRLDHFREWAQFVAQAPADKVEDEAQRLMAQDYSIHYHVWTAMEFLQLVIHCRTELHMGFEFELAQQNKDELIIVLRK